MLPASAKPRKRYPLSYRQRVLELFGSSVIAYYPLSDYLWAAALDISGNGNVASYSGTTLQAGTSPDGQPCPQFSAGQINNLAAAHLPILFSGLEGSFACWFKVTNSGVLNDGQQRFVVYLPADGNNYININKNGSGWLLVYYLAGGVTYLYNAPIHNTNWLHIAVTWSHANNRMTVYVNGLIAFRVALTSTWAGTLTSDAGIGGAWGILHWDGFIADAFLLNREMTVFENKQIGYISQPAKKISVLGDSISVHDSVYDVYPYTVMGSYNSGNVGVHDVAVGGASITADLANQVALVTEDDADIIIIALGTGDWDGGDMNALKAILRTQIDILKSTNQRASIYYLNVLPRWTDVGGGTPVLFPNVRAAIAAVCVEKSITCWDTFTAPWITSADTADGLHPNVTGQGKIATQILSRI